MSVQIFIESSKNTNEYNFINQYVKHLKDDAEIEVICVGGKDNLVAFKNLIAENTQFGGINLIIFDCDKSEIGEGGIEKRKEAIENFRNRWNLEYDYFFFPNNSDDGVFEDMLLQIVNKNHQGIIDCFSQYETCIEHRNAISGDIYEMPNLKAKIYTYITSFKRKKELQEKVKKGDWLFNDKNLWDLDSPYLSPLKKFLLKYL